AVVEDEATPVGEGGVPPICGRPHRRAGSRSAACARAGVFTQNAICASVATRGAILGPSGVHGAAGIGVWSVLDLHWQELVAEAATTSSEQQSSAEGPPLRHP